MKEALRPVGKDELVFDIEQALRKARKVWPRTRERSYGDVGPLHPAAVAVVEHLELCGIRCYRRPPLEPLGTTQGPAEAPRQDDEVNER